MKYGLATQLLQPMDWINNWLDTLATPFFDEGLHKLVSMYDKSLNLYGDSMKK